jgi:hypothetical protein
VNNELERMRKFAVKALLEEMLFQHLPHGTEENKDSIRITGLWIKI